MFVGHERAGWRCENKKMVEGGGGCGGWGGVEGGGVER